MKPVKHIGLEATRCELNPLEKKFAKAWAAHNKNWHTLGYLLGGPDAQTRRMRGVTLEEKFVSHRDAEVAATVVQWLGSEVGQDFLKTVMKKKDIE